jgi:heme o synthase
VLLGLGFLNYTLDFCRTNSDREARRVLRASLIYLPALLVLLLVDGAGTPVAFALWP